MLYNDLIFTQVFTAACDKQSPNGPCWDLTVVGNRDKNIQKSTDCSSFSSAPYIFFN